MLSQGFVVSVTLSWKEAGNDGSITKICNATFLCDIVKSLFKSLQSPDIWKAQAPTQSNN